MLDLPFSGERIYNRGADCYFNGGIIMKRPGENLTRGAFIIINAANLPLGGSIGAIDLNALRTQHSPGIERHQLYLQADKQEEEEEEEEDGEVVGGCT